ncbi:polysaccharide biosynthesis tyrosine autokinase [Oerskovia flava]|uniref:polysaccharide biosynthesis tyrosine autokinase n=1 Tax=Oerskovia flava TaxID=2986422 RepID=UPI00223F79EB|nr:polysaccharide biosynthesis tyrosine autokinase [Oerskovia sp. JB1-3-2]
MELADYLRLLRKRWLYIAVVGMIGVLAAVALSLATTPTYQATSQVYVSVRGADTSNDLAQGSAFTVRQVKSYSELVTSPRVLEPVIEELGLEETPASLAQMVSATSPLDTVLINIAVTDESADLAAQIANSAATNLAAVVAELEKPADAPESPVQISTVRPASVPESPASPNMRLNVALGLVLGLAVGFGVAVLRELLDTRIRSQDDVRSVTSSSIIGAITFDEDAPDHPLIVQESPQSPRAEAFRRLRTNLQFLELDGSARVLVMTSAIPGEGKTTTSINLAVILADAGMRVVLVDADLRRPSVSTYMGVEGSVGLTTVLIGRIGLEDAVQPWGNQNLHVLASGEIPPNPSELLGSAAMSELIHKLGTEYDVVILDTAPLLPVTDGAILAKLAGGAVVVVGAGTTHRPQLEEALGALETVGARVLGLVVNKLPQGGGSGGYHYGYEYSSRTEPEPLRRARPGVRMIGWPRREASRATVEPGRRAARTRPAPVDPTESRPAADAPAESRPTFPSTTGELPTETVPFDAVFGARKDG